MCNFNLHYYNQGGLKTQPSLSRGFLMGILHKHEYDIPLVRVGQGGPHVFYIFDLCLFHQEVDSHIRGFSRVSSNWIWFWLIRQFTSFKVIPENLGKVFVGNYSDNRPSILPRRSINGFKTFLLKNKCFEPIYRPIKVAQDLTFSLYKTPNFLTPERV